MLTALWVRARGNPRPRFVRELRRDTADPKLVLTPYEARRLAAELTEHADALDPRPKPTRGAMPYGWRYVTRGAAEPDLAEMETVDLIVEHAVAGYSRSESVTALNAVGRLNRSGRPWTRDSLRQVHLRLYREGILTEPVTVPAQNRSAPDTLV